MEERETLKKIGDKLRELRIKAGYTSYETFSYDNEIQRQSVFRAEKGENITLKTLIKLLNIHNISLEEFFKDLK